MGNLYIRNFNCCGLGEVVVGGAYTKKELDYQIKISTSGAYGEKGAYFATTIARNAGYRVVERLLKKHGWRYITRFKNPNSGNFLKFWLKVPRKRGDSGW